MGHSADSNFVVQFRSECKDGDVLFHTFVVLEIGFVPQRYKKMAKTPKNQMDFV
jgi:hypothetical protein